uniref:G-protein coupled receptors family 1 profile domain-containing protein n=1 Tax=Ditylenchus dipsaci TaxID=166011 RepID=A0A915D2H3_9BILA
MSSPPLAPSTMRILLWAICVIGITLNLAVFRRNKYTRKRYNFNIQLLSFMAAADTVSLASLMLALSTQYLGVQNFNVVAIICKVDLFLIHAASAFSIWCWLVLSAVRYLAVYRPYSHLKLNKEPLLIILTIIVICCLLEVWILYDVTFHKEVRICGETLPEVWGKRFQLVEIIWTYFLPLTLITILDVKVLCCHSTWSEDREKLSTVEAPTASISGESSSPIKKRNSSCNLKELLSLPLSNSSEKTTSSTLHTHKSNACSPLTTTISPESAAAKSWIPHVNDKHYSLRSRRKAQQMRILKRCLLISILDLAMNLPNYVIRLYLVLISDEELDQINNTAIFLWVQDISQLLYFAQFSLNALYLVGIIYVSPGRSSCSNSQTPTCNNIRVSKGEY